jgi:hypothetical protein
MPVNGAGPALHESPARHRLTLNFVTPYADKEARELPEYEFNAVYM